MRRTDQMKLGFILYGAGEGRGDWRHPDAVPDASTNFQYYKRQALAAERGKFDCVFVADSLSITPRSTPHFLSRFEPLTILSALAGATSNIGLIGTVSVSFTEPFNVARQFASLDHISGGRCGWNVVTTWLADAATNYSQTEHRAHDDRYRVAEEHLDVVQGLWDSWEADAMVGDKASGVFFDPDRLHNLNHVGEFYQVKGPLNIKRSPQGQPVIFQAGSSNAGKNFAAQRADAIFTMPQTFEASVAYYADTKLRAGHFGRDSGAVKIMPSARPVIGRTHAEAEELFQVYANLTSPEDALSLLGRAFSDYDFTGYDLDAPFPTDDVIAVGAHQQIARSREILDEVAQFGLTIRQAALSHAVPRGHFVGTAEKVADAMQNWFERRAADGFMLIESLPGQLELFVENVVPILQARGLFRREYEGPTLRSLLGLSEPQNRYTEARGVPALP